MVRKGRLELPRVAPLDPKSSASTNSATFARDRPQGYYSGLHSGPDRPPSPPILGDRIVLSSSLPYMSRPHAQLELKAWTLQAVPTGVLAGGVAGVLVNTVFASEVDGWVLALAVALATGAGPFGYVTSIAWSHWSQGRDKVRALTRLKALFTASLLITVLVPINGMGLVLLITSLLGAGILWCGIITIRSIVWRSNYSRVARTAFAARAQVLVSIVMSLVGAGAGIALDRNVYSFRWIFLVSAGCALAALFSYRRVRVRRQQRMLSSERGRTDGSHLGLAQLWHVLRTDSLYRRYLTWMFVTGSGNLMAIAPLILIFTDHLNMPKFTQIMLTTSVPTLLIPLTTPIWARVLAKRHAIAFRAFNSRFFIAVSATALAGVTLEWEPLLWLSAIFQGIGFGGGLLIWSLAHNDFAPRERNLEYMGVHVTLTGIRGLIAPLVGVGLYGLLEAKQPGLGVWSMALPLLLTTAGAIGFHTLHRNWTRSEQNGSA